MDTKWLKDLKAEFFDKFPARTVTVTGDGKVTAHSDTGILSFALVTKAPTVKQVTTANSKKMDGVMAAMKKFKIMDKDIEVSKYNLYPDYRQKDKKNKRIGSYHLEKELVVKIKKLEMIDQVLEMITKEGGDKMTLVFDVDDPSLFKKQAREKALLDARKKADEMAKVTGVTIGKVITFSENEGEQYPTHLVPASQIGFADVRGETSGPISVVESGSKEFTASVNVTYEIA